MCWPGRGVAKPLFICVPTVFYNLNLSQEANLSKTHRTVPAGFRYFVHLLQHAMVRFPEQTRMSLGIEMSLKDSLLRVLTILCLDNEFMAMEFESCLIKKIC